ncbi:Hypothetical_protein [Hexamita inflata]|uniref:Hypothetical_protein n=1 Tax=Hexamita inflata TaxID=28002 RepID=A0AA86RCX1_9EUKA|nr:Hypothetical protein HINF_LOCUS58373 [Hexamita inflata]
MKSIFFNKTLLLVLVYLQIQYMLKYNVRLNEYLQDNFTIIHLYKTQIVALKKVKVHVLEKKQFMKMKSRAQNRHQNANRIQMIITQKKQKNRNTAVKIKLNGAALEFAASE